jgi:hypothetical protein
MADARQLVRHPCPGRRTPSAVFRRAPWVITCLSLSGCPATSHEPLRTHADPGPSPSSTSPCVLDRLQPSGNKRLIVPHPDDQRVEPLDGELPLLPFTCTKQVSGIAAKGEVRFSFRPSSPTEAAFRVAFGGTPCDYEGDAKLVAGRLKDGSLQGSAVRCRRSPWSPFAVSCGVDMGVDLHLLVRGEGGDRTVQVRFPPSFHEGMKRWSECRLPFVSYGHDGQPQRIDNDRLVFNLAECKVEGR